MKKHQIRMFSIKIIKFENKKKTSNDRKFQTFKQQKVKKKIETIKKNLKKQTFSKKKPIKSFRKKFFQNENMNE